VQPVDADAEEDWGPARLYGGQLYQTGGQAKPRVIQTGSWSEPGFPADEGQDKDAITGAWALVRHWRSKKGGVYAVDPKTMGMEHGIDIGQQIQDSVDQGGYMRGVLDQAVRTGRPVPFDSAKWGGLKRFDDHPPTPDGLTVGRWGGFVQGTLSAKPDGAWSVNAGLWPQKTGQYDFTPDATGNDLQRAIGNAAIGIGHLVNGLDGAPFWINFNRVYNFQANGKYR
jgi:hypothetical protein